MNENDALESPSSQSTSRAMLQRSKSYEVKLTNEIVPDVDINNLKESYLLPKKKDSNEPQIIVTSFAPNPKARQSSQSNAIRPSSQNFHTKNVSSLPAEAVKENNQETNQ
jgi:hypothetical protein